MYLLEQVPDNNMADDFYTKSKMTFPPGMQEPNSMAFK